jgi:hypothetical protein
MKNISFEKPTLLKNFKKQVSFKKVNFCYVFPQKIDTWHEQYKASTTYCFFWFRIIFHYQVTKHTYNEISTIPQN